MCILKMSTIAENQWLPDTHCLLRFGESVNDILIIFFCLLLISNTAIKMIYFDSEYLSINVTTIIKQKFR
jgi:hypothetical protein